MFTIDGKEYELKFSLKRIDMIEAVTGGSVMNALVGTKGMLSLAEIRAFMSYGLKGTGEGEGYVSPPQGAKYADILIEELGYTSVVAPIMEALERDCPFLFRAD